MYLLFIQVTINDVMIVDNYNSLTWDIYVVLDIVIDS